MNAAERETVVNINDTDNLVHIWTARRQDITAMRSKPAYTEIATGIHDRTEWAEFTIPLRAWSLRRAVRQVLSEGERRRRADTLRASSGSRVTGEYRPVEPHDG